MDNLLEKNDDVDPKKDVYHSTLVIEILMQHFFPKAEQQITPKVAPTRV